MEVSEYEICRKEMPGMPITFLGPARVACSAGNRVRVELPDIVVWARMALAYPYKAEPGDTVLVISQMDRWYVIGVLAGRGKTSFSVPADLELRAAKGSIRLEAGRGVRISGTDIHLRADCLSFTARSLTETFENATRWIKNIFNIRAGRIKTQVNSLYRLKAKRIVEKAEEDVKIDGRKINLG